MVEVERYIHIKRQGNVLQSKMAVILNSQWLHSCETEKLRKHIYTEFEQILVLIYCNFFHTGQSCIAYDKFCSLILFNHFITLVLPLMLK